MRVVVVIDDEPDMRSLLRIALPMEGMVVGGEAADGPGGVEEVARIHPDGVILDYQMSPQTGLEVLPEIKRAWPAAQVVMFSATSTTDLMVHAGFLGASAVVDKSVGVGGLAAALRAVDRDRDLRP